MKTLAIGDIHTKLWIIEEVAKLLDKYDNIVFVGDYADDFETNAHHSLSTWYALYNLQQKFPDKIHPVAGNHDYIYVNKTPTLQTGYNHTTQVLINAPENKALKDWLAMLPIWIEVDGVTFSHAGIAKDWNDDDPLWQDLSPIWVRPGYTEYKNIPQVFGHTPSKTCWEVQPNVWCIDTFSTTYDKQPIGDHTVLEITDGKKFKKVKLNGNNSINSKSG